MKKSDSYKTLEERVGSAYENVKVNMSPIGGLIFTADNY